MAQTPADAFKDGVKYALEYLRDEVYGAEVTETAIWRDFFEEVDAE
jgi:hypothetical protein